MAVLSKYTILRARDHIINYGQEGRGYDPRTGLESVIDINGNPVTVLNVDSHSFEVIDVGLLSFA